MALSGNDRALLDACRAGDAEKVRALLAAEDDVAARDDDGWTPLHWAAAYGHADTAKLLLGAGADLTARDDNGLTPEDLVRSNRHPELADLLHEAASARRLAEPVVTGIDWAALVG